MRLVKETKENDSFLQDYKLSKELDGYLPPHPVYVL